MHNFDLEYIANTCGKARKTGRGYSCCCPAHSDTEPSLSLSMDDDVLLAYCHAGCTFEEVATALRDMGMSGSIRRNTRDADFLTEERKRQYAQSLWDDAKSPKGTPVEAYLRSRGYVGEIPDNIRYHPYLKHSPSGKHLPAMVVAIRVFPNQEVVAIHRTYLKPNGLGKADVTPNKMMLGSVKGGAAMFGSKNGIYLYIAEGVETALSVAMTTGAPTWAALSASNMADMILPPIEEVPILCIAADADDAGVTAAKRLADREYLAGRSVTLVVPEEAGVDFNDLLRR